MGAVYLFMLFISFDENPFFFIFRTQCLAITKTSRRVIIEINSLRSSWTFDSFLYKLYFLESRDLRFATIVTSGKNDLIRCETMINSSSFVSVYFLELNI